MKRVAMLALVAALAWPATAGSMEMDAASGPHISILFGSVTPVHVDAVAGDEVQWANDSVRNHTVTADDGSYDSGSLGPNEHFARMFASPGTYAYYCRLHPYIRGEIDVHELLLDRPAQPAAPGRPYPLSGRAALPAGTDVAIEYDDGSGSWQHAADASVGTGGAFSAQVTPQASGSYRAVAGADESPAVDLLVLNRRVTVTARTGRGGSRVTATVTPASPGATVVLQLYLKDHFGWWPVSFHRLGPDSRSTFTIRHLRRVSARIVLTLPDGATIVGTSPVVRLRH
jgi:plastocyanin